MLTNGKSVNRIGVELSQLIISLENWISINCWSGNKGAVCSYREPAGLRVRRYAAHQMDRGGRSQRRLMGRVCCWAYSLWVFCDVTHTLVARNMIVFCRGARSNPRIKVASREMNPSLAYVRGGFFISRLILFHDQYYFTINTNINGGIWRWSNLL